MVNLPQAIRAPLTPDIATSCAVPPPQRLRGNTNSTMGSAQVMTYGEAAQLVLCATPSATISPQQSTYRLSVIFYSPDRTFIVPVVFTMINISTSLKSLVIRLQELLNQNTNLTAFPAKLLVQSLQMRFYHDASLADLPKIEGRLEQSPTGVLDPGSSLVVWNVTNRHGRDMELFWSMLIRKLLVDQILRPHMTGKETVLKVGTVAKVIGYHFQHGNGPTGLSQQSTLVQQAEESRHAAATQAKLEFQKVAEQCETEQQKIHQSQQTDTPSYQQMRRQLNISKEDFQGSSEQEEQRRTSSLWNQLNASKAELKRLHKQAEARVPILRGLKGRSQAKIQQAIEHQNRDLVARGLDLNTPRGPRSPRPPQPYGHFLGGRREPDLSESIQRQSKKHESSVASDDAATKQVRFADPSYSNEGQEETSDAKSAPEVSRAIPVISLSTEISPRRSHRLPLLVAAAAESRPREEEDRVRDQGFRLSSLLDASSAPFTPSHNLDSPSDTNSQESIARFAPPWPQSRQADIDQKMEDAQALLESLSLADAPAEMMASIHDDASKEKYKTKLGGKKKPNEGSEWKQGGGYDKKRAVDPEANWGTYQRWGEEGNKDKNRERVHQLLDLSHVPFHGPPVEVWKKHEASGQTHDDDEAAIKETPIPHPVPYTEIDADELKDALDEERRNQPIPEHIQKYWAEQERMKGFEELDDTQYFPRHQLPPEPRSPSPKLHIKKKGKKAGGDDVDARSMFLKSVERRAYEGAHPASSRPAGIYEGRGSGGTTFSREHAAADNMFTPTLITSFGQLAKASVKSTSPALGFYELLDGIKNYKSGSSYYSYAAGQGTPDRAGEIVASEGHVSRADGYAEYQQSQEMGSLSTAHVNSDHQHDFASHEGFSNMGNSMMMAGGGGTYQNPSSFSNFNTTHPQSHPASSYFGTHSTHGQSSYHPAEQYGDLQWTSMSKRAGPPQASGAAYSSYGSQASYSNRNVSSTPVSHLDSRYSFPQHYMPTPTPASRQQPDARNRYLEAQTQGGHGQMLQGEMQGQMQGQIQAPNPTYTATTFTPAANLANLRGPLMNPRARRPIPITAPPKALSADSPAFQLPSPSRLAIGVGRNPSGSGPPSGLGPNFTDTPPPGLYYSQSPNRSPSPEKGEQTEVSFGSESAKNA
ncbi:hypothetical protein QTJ16_004113 [Diplocarpon rosae]|uniref:Uncharacterized protein n=1 Tax=Diplocarpon rosae TaxID=946125 RepID=A0AAD9T162_9HELO|nr:hypothetical protein QTJ16_004113 [Diplocarpon rosae]